MYHLNRIFFSRYKFSPNWDNKQNYSMKINSLMISKPRERSLVSKYSRPSDK